MSDTDSFIDEVTEEVRRDRLFSYLRRYGWIAVLVIVVVVGGAAWNEYRKARETAAAQKLGDDIIAALQADAPDDRVAGLAAITAETPGGDGVVQLLLAAAAAEAGQTERAVAALDQVAANGDLPQIYRQIASFKALTLQSGLSAEDRRMKFEALAQPGAPLRLLAEEQLALIDIETGDTATAINRLQAVIEDVEASTDLQQRAAQVIVALGGEPRVRPDQAG